MGYIDPTLFSATISSAKCSVPSLLMKYIDAQDAGIDCDGPYCKLRSTIYMIKMLDCVQPVVEEEDGEEEDNSGGEPIEPPPGGGSGLEV